MLKATELEWLLSAKEVKGEAADGRGRKPERDSWLERRC